LLAAAEQALRNAEQHARAEVITLSVEAEEHEVRLVVADDGVGFDPQAVGHDRFGIRGSIRARVESVGGRAVLDLRRSRAASGSWLYPSAPEMGGGGDRHSTQNGTFGTAVDGTGYDRPRPTPRLAAGTPSGWVGGSCERSRRRT